MDKWIVGILCSIGAALIIFIFKCIYNWLFFKIYKSEERSYTFFGKEIKVFRNKENTRISIGALANIENKDGEKLLIKSKRDNQWKPIGGAIKISNKILSQFQKKKFDFNYDQNTQYHAKKNDFRIFSVIKSNKLLQKVLYKQPTSFYKEELKREIMEELKISFKDFDNIFKIEDKYKISIISKKSTDSILGVRDYSEQFIFNVVVLSEEKLSSIISADNKNLKWINIRNNNKKNISITSYWLNKNN